MREFDAFARRIGRAGLVLRRHIDTGIRDAAPEIAREVVHRGARDLPRRGGYAASVASRTVRSTIGVVAGRGLLSISGPMDLAHAESGRLRHPVFGHRPTVVQFIRPGAFSRALPETAPILRRALAESLERAISDLA